MAIRAFACIVLSALAFDAAARTPEIVAVKDSHATHLGITVEAPGIEKWHVAETRYKAGWRILYRGEELDDSTRTSGVFLKSDRYRSGKFVKEHGSLEKLANQVLSESRSPDDAHFRELSAAVARDDSFGAETYRIRMVSEERNNPHHPGVVLVLEVAQLLMLHPQNPDQVISVAASTRYPQEKEPLSADELLARFVQAMRYE